MREGLPYPKLFLPEECGTSWYIRECQKLCDSLTLRMHPAARAGAHVEGLAVLHVLAEAAPQDLHGRQGSRAGAAA